MTRMKALSATIIFSAAIAAPVLAQDANYRGPYDQDFRRAYDRSKAESYAQPLTYDERRNLENFGFSGRDPSRVGGEDPYLHPGG
jgi:hypothetical protein